MSVSNKIRAMLNIKNMKTQDLAACLNISVQAVRNKFTRDSFSVSDLIKICSFLDCELLFKINDSQYIELSMEDLKIADASSMLAAALDTMEEPKIQDTLKPFTKTEEKQINLDRLQTDGQYQIEIEKTFGANVLAMLMKKGKRRKNI